MKKTNQREMGLYFWSSVPGGSDKSGELYFRLPRREPFKVMEQLYAARALFHGGLLEVRLQTVVLHPEVLGREPLRRLLQGDHRGEGRPHHLEVRDAAARRKGRGGRLG